MSKYPKLTVRDTRKYGKGVFAAEPIKKGSVIHVLSGKRLSVYDLVKNINAGKEFIDDPFQIGKKTYLDLDELSRTFNHSCNPSAGIRKTSELFALRDIVAGEEVTYDYSLTVAPTVWSMKCKCGSTSCRKVIGDIRSLTKSQRNAYMHVGAVQRYMREIIKQLDTKSYSIPSYELWALANIQ